MTRLAFAVLLISSLAYAEPGSIKGTVLFEGEPPTQPKLDGKLDKACPQGKDDEAIFVTKGKLRDVLVRIKNGTIDRTAPPFGGAAGREQVPAIDAAAKPPATPVVIDQRGCMYTPRVVGLVAGQALAIRNSDTTFHNVHGVLHGKDLANKMQGPKAADLAIDATTAKADDVIELSCNVHTWMKAYAVVQDHPFFAVTAADGTFEIKGIPPGTYTLETWHPVLGTRTLTVKIGKTPKLANVTARFSYKATEL